jgi:hypothetical protein
MILMLWSLNDFNESYDWIQSDSTLYQHFDIIKNLKYVFILVLEKKEFWIRIDFISIDFSFIWFESFL